MYADSKPTESLPRPLRSPDTKNPSISPCFVSYPPRPSFQCLSTILNAPSDLNSLINGSVLDYLDQWQGKTDHAIDRKVSWNKRDLLIYALSIGASATDYHLIFGTMDLFTAFECTY